MKKGKGSAPSTRTNSKQKYRYLPRAKPESPIGDSLNYSFSDNEAVNSKKLFTGYQLTLAYLSSKFSFKSILARDHEDVEKEEIYNKKSEKFEQKHGQFNEKATPVLLERYGLKRLYGHG